MKKIVTILIALSTMSINGIGLRPLLRYNSSASRLNNLLPHKPLTPHARSSQLPKQWTFLRKNIHTKSSSWSHTYKSKPFMQSVLLKNRNYMKTMAGAGVALAGFNFTDEETIKGLPNGIPTVTAHGWRNNKYGGKMYNSASNVNGFIDEDQIIFNFRDHKNPSESCMGGKDDRSTLRTITSELKKYQLAGYSRGAVTILGHLADQQPNVPLAILESPYDDLSKLPIFKKAWAGAIMTAGLAIGLEAFTGVKTASLGSTIYEQFPRNYDRLDMKPLKAASKVRHDTAMLIVCSLQDKIVPARNSINIYKAAKTAGHPNVYLLILNQGLHGQIIKGSSGHIYRNVVHALKKRQGLPHNPVWAKHGESKLNSCQPSLEQTQELLFTR